MKGLFYFILIYQVASSLLFFFNILFYLSTGLFCHFPNVYTMHSLSNPPSDVTDTCIGYHLNLWTLKINNSLQKFQVYAWLWKQQFRKHCHHRLHLVAVMVLSVKSHDAHQQMEFAHLPRSWLFSKLLFPRKRNSFGTSAFKPPFTRSAQESLASTIPWQLEICWWRSCDMT